MSYCPSCGKLRCRACLPVTPTRPSADNWDEIIAAVVEYRAACDAIGPAWDAFAPLYGDVPETVARRNTRHRYIESCQRVETARKRLIEACLDGRSEVPR